MRKKVTLQVLSEDQQLWFIMDDHGIVLSGPGVEMVQAFCHLAGQTNYTLTPAQLRKYDVVWNGTLRLLRQQSMYAAGQPKAVARNRPPRKQQPEPPVPAIAEQLDNDFFD